ncbi:MAG: Ig-like domain-containing protein [Pirellulales bacterium]
MRRVSTLGSMIVLVCFAAAANGEQQVKLQSGATLVGNVSTEGSDLVVDVDGAKIPVPFKDVASVTPASQGQARDAERLLIKAIEAQMLTDDEKVDTGLFAEAFRLAPDDPRTAFWYARSLVKAGFGKGANEVFEPRREAIVAAYPGAADRLADQIQERLALEKLPAPLVARLDEISAAAKQPAPINAEKTAYAAYFQLIDQAGEPIERSDFEIQSNGEEGNLESFADGHHLYTFARDRHFGDNPCQLNVSRPGLVSASFSFEGGTRGAQNVGVLKVTRLSEKDRKPVTFKVLDPAGQPLSGATITLNAVRQRGNSDAIAPLQVNADGVASATLYPNQYYCQVSRKAYNPISQPLTVPLEGEEPVAVEAKLYPAIQATIKVEWQARAITHPGMPPVAESSLTSGEFEQTIDGTGAAGMPVGRFGIPWVRLMQSEDQLQLQFMDRSMFGPSEPAWVGRLAPETQGKDNKKLDAQVNAELFDVLSLDELDALAQEFKIDRVEFGGMPRPNGQLTLPIEAGDIYLGRIMGHVPETNRPAMIEFKLLATEVVRP